MNNTLLEEIARMVAELAQGGGPGRLSADLSSEPLDELFHTLRHTDDDSKRAEAEDLIWALWCSHEDEDARRALNHAIGAISRHELEQAEPLLDELVETWPGWAEAWNKRATLHYLRDQHIESVQDIRRTLALEPRHFGALSGFGRICLQAGDEHSALVAFDYALEANPNLSGVQDTAAALRDKLRPQLH